MEERFIFIISEERRVVEKFRRGVTQTTMPWSHD
jgi:hypothetical protein